MVNKYKNSKGVYIESHTNKSGKDHISIYNKNPSNLNHQSIHINYNTKTGKGNIVESNGSGGKTTTGIGCYLTTSCIKHFKENFDDNCFELTILRWFRDNFVSQDDIEHYYKIAPIIVEGIEKTSNIVLYMITYMKMLLMLALQLFLKVIMNLHTIDIKVVFCLLKKLLQNLCYKREW